MLERRRAEELAQCAEEEARAARSNRRSPARDSTKESPKENRLKLPAPKTGMLAQEASQSAEGCHEGRDP